MSVRSSEEIEIEAIPLGDGPDASSERDDSDHADIEHVLRQLQDVVWRYPMAAQAAFSALVAEGRAYEQTPEGAEYMRRLLHSPRSHRLRVIWEILTLSSMEEKSPGALPSLFLDKLAKTLLSERVEPILSRLFERGRRGG